MINPELDLAILVLFLSSDTYKRYISVLDVYSLSNEGQIIIKSYEEYFKEFPNVNNIDLTDFVPWFFNFNKTLTNIDHTSYKHIFSRFYNIETDKADNVLLGLKYRKLGSKILKTLGVSDLIEDKMCSLKYFDSSKLEENLRKFNETLSFDSDLYTHNVEEVFNSEDENHIESRIRSLNNIIKGYKSDFFYLIVAGTDGGKTAFCISEASYLASMGKKVLFFTNEQSSKMIRQRVYAALLNNKNMNFMDFKNFVINNKDTTQKKYSDLGGNNIEIINVFGKSLDFIKRYADKYSPSLIVLDQVDNLLSGKVLDGSPRPYNDVYKRIRSEIAQVYAPVIGTTQAKNRGKYYDKDTGAELYVQNIGSGDVHWSNVDKQANVDVLIGVGVMNGDHAMRHITVDRNKEGLLGDCYCRLLTNSSRFIE